MRILGFAVFKGVCRVEQIPGLRKIRLRGSNRVIEVIPAVAAARVAGGTADYVNDLPAAIGQASLAGAQSARLQGSPERAVSPAQDPPAKNKRK
jgi:hypothetical protein